MHGFYSRAELDRIATQILGERLDGRPKQGIYEASDHQNYVLGSRLQLGDRVFRYAKAGGTLNCDLLAVPGYEQLVAFTTIAANAVAGASSVVIDVAATDGPNGDGEIAANLLAGGYLVVFPGSNNSFVRGIVTNTAVPAGGGEMTLRLSEPIPVALTADTMHGECMASPYLDILTGNYPQRGKVGVPTVAATDGQFLWIQTWGPCWIAPQAEVGDEDHDQQVVARHDGSLDEHDYSDTYTTKAQHVGFVLTSAKGGGQGAPFIFLQIAP